VSLEAGRIASRILTRAKRGCCMNICTQQADFPLREDYGLTVLRTHARWVRNPPITSYGFKTWQISPGRAASYQPHGAARMAQACAAP